MLASVSETAKVAPRRKPSQMDGVDSVLLDFALPDNIALPKSLQDLPVLDAKPPATNEYAPGSLFIAEHNHVGIRAYLFELKDMGFELCHADAYEGKLERHIRFVFRRETFGSPAEICRTKEFEPVLDYLSRGAWILHAYSNPHVHLPNTWGMSIICRGAPGQRKPAYYLRIAGGRTLLD